MLRSDLCDFILWHQGVYGIIIEMTDGKSFKYKTKIVGKIP